MDVSIINETPTIIYYMVTKNHIAMHAISFKLKMALLFSSLVG